VYRVALNVPYQSSFFVASLSHCLLHPLCRRRRIKFRNYAPQDDSLRSLKVAPLPAPSETVASEQKEAEEEAVAAAAVSAKG
jgi:hypothetical protein